ncbi:MAG: AAA family ATPase [Lachnospiraceae bacterium]|nr:AAA family ATPase [Lachnospiraceae bacterium]
MEGASKFEHLDITLGIQVKKSQYEEKRDCYHDLDAFMKRHELHYGKVCALYGLRRTGKTELMFQYIFSMDEEEKKKTVYIRCNEGVDMLEIRRCLDAMIDIGIENFFLDEITFADDFQAFASSLSDHYATNFGRIVIAGTDSLGIRLACSSQLFDRAYMIHTSHVPYAEYARLRKSESIDDYITYGGLLTNEYYQDGKRREEYMNTSIVDNILNSLIDAGEHRRYFSNLATRFDHDELRSIINRMINKFSYNVVLRSLNKRFQSAPLAVTLNTPTMEKYVDRVDKGYVDAKVKEAAKILEPEEMKTTLAASDLEDI